MIVTRLWRVAKGPASEWEGRNNLGEFVVVRCVRGLVELRSQLGRRPGEDDVVTLAAIHEYDPEAGPDYGCVRDCLATEGHTLPWGESGPGDGPGRSPPAAEHEGVQRMGDRETTGEAAALPHGAVSIRRPDDFHSHLRQGPLLRATVHAQAGYYGRVLAMPNTKPAIRNGEAAVEYRGMIEDAYPSFRPLMTIMLDDETTPATILAAREKGVVAAKLYPRGATTNSGSGVSDPLSSAMRNAYDAMAECGMVLCVHPEDPAGEIMTRERDYLAPLRKIVNDHDSLRVVVEHISMGETAAWVSAQRQGVAGTITAHHLLCTTDDVLGAQGLDDPALKGGGPKLVDGLTSPAIRPHYYCLPVPKSRTDRAILLSLATSGNPKFFFGSDSAPHEVGTKECAYGCAGVFMPARVALGALAWAFSSFAKGDWVAALEKFASTNGAKFYGLAPNEGTILLRRRDWLVPDMVAGVVPFAAGHSLPWEPYLSDIRP